MPDKIFSEPQNNVYPQISVMGMGGGGCNTVNRLSSSQIPGIQLIAANTDNLSLKSSAADKHLLLGKSLTRGLGSGGDPLVGQKAAEESFRELIAAIEESDMLFLTAGMGGGTGSGAIQIAARIAKSLGILTIAMVTTPFSFEAGTRSKTAHEWTARLRPFVDTLITIPNDRLIDLSSKDTTLHSAFALADDLLVKGIHTLSGLLHTSGLINLDFSHLLRLMRQDGGCYISNGIGRGPDKVLTALRNAISHPLLEEIPLQNAKGMIIKFNGNLNLAEIEAAMHFIKGAVSPDAELITAIEEDSLLKDTAQVMVLVTGIGAIPIQNQPVMDEAVILDEPLGIFEPTPNLQPISYEPAETIPYNLEVPAFIRRGYNQAAHAFK